jgi:hypothetical protein
MLKRLVQRLELEAIGFTWACMAALAANGKAPFVKRFTENALAAGNESAAMDPFSRIMFFYRRAPARCTCGEIHLRRADGLLDPSSVA